MINVEEAMARLAVHRPVFHSEADFQHELAWEVRTMHPGASVRLERPLGNGLRGATDMVVSVDGKQHAFELKYMTKRFNVIVADEAFALKQQSAQDHRRYDVCKDIRRMDAFRRNTGFAASVLVLTNEPLFWSASQRLGNCAAFSIADGGTLSGDLAWSPSAGAGTTSGREEIIRLSGTYELGWREYSSLDGASGRFRYLQIDAT